MGWNQAKFLEDLTGYVDRFDRAGASRLCDELIQQLDAGTRLEEGVGRKVLAMLRRKAYFDLMEKAAEALRFADQDDTQVRRQYAQALIDQGRNTAAAYVLEALIERTQNDATENAEARGLLGRLYKQLYVNAANAAAKPAANAQNRLNLQRALDSYLAVYRSGPSEHLWHGINAAAVAARAARDGIAALGAPDHQALARDILAALEARERRAADRLKGVEQRTSLAAWDLATGAEAALALGDTDAAERWLAQYVKHAGADAFELASTLRQFKEVWGLTIEALPGSRLLPILQSQLLERQGGRVDVAAGELATTIQKTEEQLENRVKLEKILGTEGVVSLIWYRLGLERARTVAKVQTKVGDPMGTGFLLRGGDLLPALGDEVLLLTNAHVVSNDPAVQAKHRSLDPDDAAIVFEAFEPTAGQQFRVRELLWTSPPEELDATLLRVEPPLPQSPPLPIAKRLPVVDGAQKVYVIGHPGGRSLSISLNDNLLLDVDDRLIHYRAPTEGGSSGSPVFNQQWDLIGLHHAGGMEMPRLNGKSGKYPANEGIWIRRIIRALAEAGVA